MFSFPVYLLLAQEILDALHPLKKKQKYTFLDYLYFVFFMVIYYSPSLSVFSYLTLKRTSGIYIAHAHREEVRESHGGWWQGLGRRMGRGGGIGKEESTPELVTWFPVIWLAVTDSTMIRLWRASFGFKLNVLQCTLYIMFNKAPRHQGKFNWMLLPLVTSCTRI
jgi:hypothetical protein